MIPVTTAALMFSVGAGARAAWLATASVLARHRLDLARRRPLAGGRWLHTPGFVVRRAEAAGVAPEVVGSAWPLLVAVTACSFVASTVLFGAAGFLAAGVVTGAGPWLIARRRASVARRRRARALPGLLEAVARALRSGASLRQALDASLARADAALVPELSVVCDAVAHGSTVEAALEAWSRRQPSEGLRLAVAALTLGIDVGGAPGRALDGVAASLRDRLAVDREVAALSSQARSSAVVMVIAPVVFAALAVAADRRTGRFLVGTPTGLACLATGLALDALAAWWMLRLTEAR